MKKGVFVVLGAALLGATTSFHAAPAPGWEPLLDKSLSKWQTFQSYRHQLGYRGQTPTDAKGQPVPPIGYDKTRRTSFR